MTQNTLRVKSPPPGYKPPEAYTPKLPSNTKLTNGKTIGFPYILLTFQP